MALNSGGQAQFEATSNLPGSGDDFVAAGWLRFGDPSGIPVAAVFEPQGFYVYGYEGNLWLQNVDCGEIPDGYIYAVLRRTGGVLTLSAVARGSNTFVELGEEPFFGTGGVTVFKLWSDEVFGPPADMDLAEWRMWTGPVLPSDEDLLIERWHHHPQFTEGLVHHWRFVDPIDYGHDEVDETPASTNDEDAIQDPRHFVVVTDSVGAGGPLLGGPYYERAWAQSDGVIAAFPSEFVLDNDLAIPGIQMAQHLAWAYDDDVDRDDLGLGAHYTGIAAKLKDVPPGSFVDVFGGLNDHWSYTPSETRDSIAGIGQIIQSFGCVPTVIGPTTAPGWSTQSYCAELRTLLAGDAEADPPIPPDPNFEHHVDPGDEVTGHYGTSFPDGIHPADAGLATLTDHGIARRVAFLTGIEPEEPEEPLAAQGLTVQAALGSPTLRVRHRLVAQGLTAQGALASPAMRSRIRLSTETLTVQAALGTPALAARNRLAAEELAIQGTLGSPGLTLRNRVAASGLSVQAALGSPTLRVRHRLVAQGLTVQAALESPSVITGESLVAQGLSVQAALGSPTLRVRHRLVAQGLTVQAALGNAAPKLRHKLLAQGLTVQANLGITSVRTGVFVAQGLSVQAALGSPTLRVRHRLVAQGLIVHSHLSAPALPRDEDEISPTVLTNWRPGIRFTVSHRRTSQ